MADLYDSEDPTISTKMRSNADFFETKAIEVQLAGVDEHKEIALNGKAAKPAEIKTRVHCFPVFVVLLYISS